MPSRVLRVGLGGLFARLGLFAALGAGVAAAQEPTCVTLCQQKVDACASQCVALGDAVYRDPESLQGYGQPKPNEEQRERWKANIMGYGISEKDAEAEIARELEEDFLTKVDRYYTVYASLLTWSFGVVEK